MLMSAHRPLGDLENPSEFIARHIGISAQDETHMLGVIGEASRRALIESIVPRSIARSQGMQLPAPVTEAAAQHPRKPRLVHRLHPLSSRNFTRPYGSLSEFSNHGLRSHRHGHCQCFYAG